MLSRCRTGPITQVQDSALARPVAHPSDGARGEVGEESWALECTAAVLVAAGHESTPPNYEAMYNTRFWNVYNDVNEETVRFGTFKSNVETIRATNGANVQNLMFKTGFSRIRRSNE